MEELEETCYRCGYRIFYRDISLKALIFKTDGVIIINPALMTTETASNILAWAAGNPFKPQPRREN